MARLKDISQRINSVTNTRKTTRAMEMVAAARLRKAQARIEALRPWAERLAGLMQEVASHVDDRRRYPLLRLSEREERAAIVLLTGDRGLAGGFNANAIRYARELHEQLKAEGRETTWLVVGRKGIETLKFRGHSLAMELEGITDRPQYADAEALAGRVISLFEEGAVDRVHLVYNRFHSAMDQRVAGQVLLPIGEEAIAAPAEPAAPPALFLFEPDAAAILERLLPDYVYTTVYRALLESTASEHGARMIAMRKASDNAGEIIDKLTLELNRARQAAITRELLEVVAGAEALR